MAAWSPDCGQWGLEAAAPLGLGRGRRGGCRLEGQRRLLEAESGAAPFCGLGQGAQSPLSKGALTAPRWALLRRKEAAIGGAQRGRRGKVGLWGSWASWGSGPGSGESRRKGLAGLCQCRAPSSHLGRRGGTAGPPRASPHTQLLGLGGDRLGFLWGPASPLWEGS